MYDVITIGAATIDAFVWSKEFQTLQSKKFSTGIGECFALGSKIDISRLEISTGGGATNAAATFANFDYDVACVTRVGKDLFGDGIVDDLGTLGIDTKFVVRDPREHTAFSTILVLPSGERTVLTYRGASEHFRPIDLKFAWSDRTTTVDKWLYVTNMAGRLDVMKRIVMVRQAHHDKMKLFWNPGAAELRLGLGRLRPILRAVDVLDMNREEAALLTGLLSERLPEMCAKIAKVCAGTILVTDGDKGAYAFANGRLFFAQPTGIKALNRTGAGDAFGSGFVAGLMRWNDVARALQLATVNAEGVIQKIGAKAGLFTKWPTEKELEEIKITTSLRGTK